MRKMLLLAAFVALLALSLATSPAFAHDHFFNDNHFFNDSHDNFRHDFFFDQPFFFNDFGFDNDCPFAGDFEGPVNEFDCFD